MGKAEQKCFGEKNLSYREKTTVRFNDCFLNKTSLAKNLQMVFGGGWVGGGHRFLEQILKTLFQDLCSTGKNFKQTANFCNGLL